MNLYAYTRTIRDILGANRKYIIPRFQREYSWGEEELSILWNDIMSNIKYEDLKFKESEYFIGALVLVGDDASDTEFEVVDGQQRITTITILFSALTEIFKNIGEDGSVNGTYKYIEGKDDDDKTFVKLVNENPKPFFQFRIQAKEKNINKKANGEEETNLLKAYDYFLHKLSEKNIKSEIKKRFQLNKFNYVEFLKIIRSQVLAFKTVYITVSNIDEAYTIFETLNAKGKDLEAIDLIKNKIFKKLSSEAPADYARETWKEIKNTLYSRKNKINMSTFYRHFWLSKYSFTTESKLYNDFNKRISESDYEKFLEELNSSSKTYLKITNPQEEDWTQQEEKWIYDSLQALNLFNTTQVRTFLIALIKQREEKKISFKDFSQGISMLENFHFVFTAITSSRPSGLESKYSKFARKLLSCDTKEKSRKVIEELKEDLLAIKPKYETFEEGFRNLYFTNDVTRDKKIIQYIFRKIELYYHKTDELGIKNITIEHILPQSTMLNEVGYIGNLLPLDKTINSDMGDIEFTDKIKELSKSELEINKRFIHENEEKEKWTITDINNRSKSLAKLCYDLVWSF